MALFGRRQMRAEDAALITGQGRFVADIDLPEMAHAVIVRSPVARATIRRIDTAAAMAAPGVIAVFVAEDLPAAARILPDCHPHPALTHVRGLPVLAAGEVRHVGEPVAAVIAEDRYLAEDAAELVEVDYDTLPAVIDLRQASTDAARRVHDDMPSNVAARLPVAMGDTTAAFANAACVVSERLEIHRGAGQAMETRGVIADWDAADRRMVVWNVSQVPYVHRTAIANALELPERSVQVRSPDVGGGFGYKGLTYTEDILIPVIARSLGRPVKWIEDRVEHLTASYQERTQLHDMEMATDADGLILGIRGTFLHDTGAYTPWGPVVPLLTVVNIPGPYKVPSYSVEAVIVYTNTVSVVPVRGAGRPQAVFVTERLLDAVAGKLGLDPADVRRRNLIQPDEYPYDVGFVSRDGTRRTYDSGDVPALLDRALALIRYDERRSEQAALREDGRYIGIGMACCVEDTGLGPYEEVEVSFERDGAVTVRMGTPSQGQGQKTTFAQLVADELSVPFEAVTVLTGNTDYVRHSIGTFASRAGIVTGSAVANAAQELKQRVLKVGAALLQANQAELELRDGRVRLAADPGRSVGMAEIVETTIGEAGNPLALRELGPGMRVIGSFCPPTNTFASGAHAAVVEVDPKTCKVAILQYAAVEDVGNVINPMIVDGQVIGGVAHGIGNSFLERVHYDEAGHILTGTFMDYLLPTTMDVPRIDVDYVPTVTSLNPLGMKGAGQGGTIPVASVLTAAVEDALSPFGIHLTSVPFSESELFALLDTARAARATG